MIHGQLFFVGLITILNEAGHHVHGQDCVSEQPSDCHLARTSRYRSVDGSCNNIVKGNADPKRSKWGKAFTCFNRFLPANYGDHWGNQITMAVDGSPLPNVREISNLLFRQELPKPSKIHSQEIPNFGQILANEIAYTAVTFEYSDQLDGDICCNPTPGIPKHPRCAEVTIAEDDEFYGHFGSRCIPIRRSEACPTCADDQRQQIVMRTPFLDMNNLYSESRNDSDILRLFSGGKLKLSRDGMLPKVQKDKNTDCGNRWAKYYPEDDQIDCFQGGDDYFNQNGQKASLLIAFAREHNLIAKELEELNPHWDDEQLFQETRKIIGAMMEMITFNEWLPAVLGPRLMAKYSLAIKKQGFSNYDSEINPTLTIEFSSSAFRSFGHSVITGDMFRTFENGSRLSTPLKDNFVRLIKISAHFDAWLRGAISEPMEEADMSVQDTFRNFGEMTPGHRPYGVDFVLVDLQRSRETGVASYSSFVTKCLGKVIKNFDDLEHLIPEETLLKIKSIYKNVHDVELYVGGLAEHKTPGALVGPTFGCLFGEQFKRIKFGDRYYFEHGGQSGSFSPKQLDSLRQVSLAGIICRTGNHFTRIQRRVMFLPSRDNPLTNCDDIPHLDLRLFKTPGVWL